MALQYENEANEIAGYDENGVKLACVQFSAVNGDTVNVEHTEVSPLLQGQGIGQELMERLVKRLRDEKKRAVLTCSYAEHWFQKHPENDDLVVE